MIFREIREDLLKISISDFATEYGVPISVVEELEKNNEVPISLIRMISKKSGYSVGDLIKYDGSQNLQETNKTPTDDSSESNVPSFSVVEKVTVVSQFNDWLKDNKQSLAYSKDVEDWAKDSIGWILDEYDKSQQTSVPDNEKITAKDIEDYSERLVSVSLNEIKRLHFILNNRNKSQIIIKNAVNLEVTRLMTEDSILEKKTNDLNTVKEKYLKETHIKYPEEKCIAKLEKEFRINSQLKRLYVIKKNGELLSYPIKS